MGYTKANIVKEANPEGSVRKFQVSDASIDRDNDIIVLEKMDLKEFKKNPVIMYVHSANKNPNPDLVIGKAPKIWFEDNNTKLFSTAKFDVDGENEVSNALAKKVLYKYDEGYLNMASIGYGVDWEVAGYGQKSNGEKEDVWYWRKSELHEWSAVPVPANRNASIQRSFERNVLYNVEEWRKYIDTEGLKGDDLEYFLKKGIKGAPELMYLEDTYYQAPTAIKFYFDIPEVKEENPTKIGETGYLYRLARARQINI